MRHAVPMRVRLSALSFALNSNRKTRAAGQEGGIWVARTSVAR
jgi:hypothetical protein